MKRVEVTCLTGVLERFWAKVAVGGPDECWPWLAYRRPKGYGDFVLWERTHVMPHRFAYELRVGPIPDGYHVDHLCRNRACCNPAHLESVTPVENYDRSRPFLLRGADSPMGSRTHCPQGHPYDEANTYRAPKGGRRQCRACRSERKKAS